MQSLIEQDQAQLRMSSLDMPAAFFEAEENAEGAYTGARLFAKKPETYKQIVALLAEGHGVIRIAKLLCVSTKTIRGVRDRERGPIAIEKDRLGRLALDAARMSIEGVIEDLDDEKTRAAISTKDKAIVAGIMAEKGQLLTGGPTSRVEHTNTNPGHDDFNRMLQEIGCGGETPGQRGQVEAVRVSVEAVRITQGPGAEARAASLEPVPVDLAASEEALDEAQAAALPPQKDTIEADVKERAI